MLTKRHADGGAQGATGSTWPYVQGPPKPAAFRLEQLGCAPNSAGSAKAGKGLEGDKDAGLPRQCFCVLC